MKINYKAPETEVLFFHLEKNLLTSLQSSALDNYNMRSAGGDDYGIEWDD